MIASENVGGTDQMSLSELSILFEYKKKVPTSLVPWGCILMVFFSIYNIQCIYFFFTVHNDQLFPVHTVITHESWQIIYSSSWWVNQYTLA